MMAKYCPSLLLRIVSNGFDVKLWVVNKARRNGAITHINRKRIFLSIRHKPEPGSWTFCFEDIYDPPMTLYGENPLALSYLNASRIQISRRCVKGELWCQALQVPTFMGILGVCQAAWQSHIDEGVGGAGGGASPFWGGEEKFIDKFAAKTETCLCVFYLRG